MNTATQRIEHDLLGDRPVPVDVYYGVHTLRPLQLPVEACLARVVIGGGGDAVLDGAGDDDIADSPVAEAADVAIRVGRLSRFRQREV